MTAIPAFAIDAHAHVFRRGLTLVRGHRYAPDYDAPVDLYLEQLDRNGMSHGVLVQPSFLGTDNSYLVESLRRAGGRLRGVAVVSLDRTGDELRELDRAGVVGIRLNLVGQLIPDLGAPRWISLLRSVSGLGWHVEVQRRASDMATIIPRLLDAGVSVVVDHFGLPDPAAGTPGPGIDALLTFGRSRNVWMKISAPYRSGPEGEDLTRGFYPQLRDAFGLDRLMWGSDWPHTQFESTQTYEANRLFLDALVSDDVERATVLASPRALYRF